MKRFFFLIILSSFAILGCNQSKTLDYSEIISKFNKVSDTIQLVSYQVRRVDTFGQGTVWDNKGFAHLERNIRDTIFGFNFYGKRDDVDQISIYDQGKNFDLDTEEMIYEITPGGYYFVGSPGGQMISTSFFKLDASFETVSVEPHELGYIIIYTYPDDSLYLITERRKEIFLGADYLPRQLMSTSLNQGEKNVTSLAFSDVKINDEVVTSLESYKEQITAYSLIEPEEYTPSKFIGSTLPELTLTELYSQETSVFKTDKVLLIDFWETWCGPCIKSLPNVQQLSEDYKDHLMVIGISTESREKSMDLLKAKNITFKNYFGDQELLDYFNVNGWPTYILVDKNGMVVKEYFGFTEAMQNDIKELIDETS